MRALVDDWSATMADRPGWLGGTYGFTDDGRFLGVVRFDSADACRESSSHSDAGLWWASAESLCDGACEIHESGDVSLMKGRVGDAERMRHLVSDEMSSMLHQARPEILGATMAIEDDGHFVETIAFTDEASARRGEQMDMPADVREELASAMADVEYLDLHRPWFASHR
jgi:hypothetical protein